MSNTMSVCGPETLDEQRESVISSGATDELNGGERKEFK